MKKEGLPALPVAILIVSGIIFFVCSCDDTYNVEPVVYTYQVADSNVTATTAKLTGQIQILGTQQIVEHGIEIYKESILATPITKSLTSQATTDTFTVVVTGLQPNTLYYYWAYAKVNTTNVHSQNTPSFTTKAVK
ncbi:MAG TPA: hypothetical protein VMT63_12410 [Bacteroidales bacterium]|nr:hypothetical protein [Bacteroidales bacterium]